MDDNPSHNKNTHPGFKFGIIGGILIGFLFMIQLLMLDNYLDTYIILISIPVLFFLGRSAAMGMYHSQQDELEPLNNVQSAGMGAGLVAMVIIWLAIIIRGVVRDAMGVNILADPLSLCLNFGFSGLAAIIMGMLGGRSVVKQYSSSD